jgi:hypothetical protein
MFELEFLVDDEAAPMADALLVQAVSDPARLLWSPPGGGFFVEASEPPAGFEPTRMRTREGREVAGFAARVLRIFPAAVRRRWEIGEPGARKVIPAYQEGARSHLQLLGLLESGVWVVVTARGLAAKDLHRAWQDHVAWVRARLRAPDGRPLRPLAALLEMAAGKPRRVGSSMATPFERVVHEEPIRIPPDLARVARDRWAEVQVWARGPNGEETRSEPDFAPGTPEASEVVPAAPEPTPEPAPEAATPVPGALASEAAPAAAESAPVPPVWMDAPAAAPATPAPEGAEGPGPDAEAGLLFLLGMGGSIAMARLRQAFEDLPEEPTEAVRELARRKPQAGFWKDVPRALDHFLAWTEEFPRLRAIAPARLRALKERLGLVPASVREEELQELAALAALRWLFRPREREALEALLREPDLA